MQSFERLGWTVLVLVVIALMFLFAGSLVGRGVDEFLHSFLRPWDRRASLAGIELTIIPLSAIIAAWLRPGADRLRAVREGRASAHLPLVMAATLAGLAAYLAWSWLQPLDLGPEKFGYTRWLGAVLAAAFTIIWQPLFPRLTATLAGMIAGPAVFAAIGYAFLEPFVTDPPPTQCHEFCLLTPMFPIAAMQLGFVILSRLSHRWLVPCLLLSVLLVLLPHMVVLVAILLLLFALLFVGLRSRPRLQEHPLTCATVSGALAAGLAVIGARSDGGYFDFPWLYVSPQTYLVRQRIRCWMR